MREKDRKKERERKRGRGVGGLCVCVRGRVCVCVCVCACVSNQVCTESWASIDLPSSPTSAAAAKQSRPLPLPRSKKRRLQMCTLSASSLHVYIVDRDGCVHCSLLGFSRVPPKNNLPVYSKWQRCTTAVKLVRHLSGNSGKELRYHRMWSPRATGS